MENTTISNTTKKLMRKYGCSTIEEYRKKRKENRAAEKANRPEKAPRKVAAAPTPQRKKRK